MPISRLRLARRNVRLQEMCRKMYKKGLGVRDLGLVDIAPRERTDDVEVLW